MIMCSAIFWRIVLIGSLRVLAVSARGRGAEGCCEPDGACCGGGSPGYGPPLEALGSGASVPAYVLAACEAINASTSCLVIRPPTPVPRTCERSILYSRAILRTSGESGP